MARPDRHESKRRKVRFLTLCASGLTPEEAARAARIDSVRAFAIAADPQFPAILDAFRRHELAA